MLIAAKLPESGESLHALKILGGLKSAGGGGRRIGGRGGIPVTSHLMPVGSSSSGCSSCSGGEGKALGKSLAAHGGHVQRFTGFLSPSAFYQLLIDFGIVHGHNGMCGSLFCGESTMDHKSVRLIRFDLDSIGQYLAVYLMKA